MSPLCWRRDQCKPKRRLPPALVVRRPGASPPPPANLSSKRWRDLILRVWHVDPLRCPVCQSPMRVMAVIDDPLVAEKILHTWAPGTTRPPAYPRRVPQGPTPTNRVTTSPPPRTTRMR